MSFQVWSTPRTVSAGQQTILELLCVSLMVTSEQNITARSRCLSRICPIFNSRCRRVRFARFYIVCEEVPLGTPESPLIVCGLSDTLRECPNVAKTRNGMPATAWKKYVNFASKNLPPSVYSGTFLFSGLLIILLITPKHDMLIVTAPSAYFYYSSLFLIL